MADLSVVLGQIHLVPAPGVVHFQADLVVGVELVDDLHHPFDGFLDGLHGLCRRQRQVRTRAVTGLVLQKVVHERLDAEPISEGRISLAVHSA